MESSFSFKSQICTDIEQSKKLLSLGLKKKTADCVLRKISSEVYVIEAMPFCEYVDGIAEDYIGDSYIPAWSLHRLAEMLASQWGEVMLFLPDAYDDIISDIEIEIGRGDFNKEYLV